jgi:hypothetical protein
MEKFIKTNQNKELSLDDLFYFARRFALIMMAAQFIKEGKYKHSQAIINKIKRENTIEKRKRQKARRLSQGRRTPKYTR